MAKHSRAVACSTKKHEALAYVWNLNRWCSTTEMVRGVLAYVGILNQWCITTDNINKWCRMC
jgi:hypothetical protein